MNRNLSARLLMLTGLFLAWPQAVNASEPYVGLLLRLQISTQEFGPPTPTSECLIYKDGLVIDRTIPSEGVERVSYQRAVADPGALRRLKIALVRNRVGQLQVPASCSAPNPFPTSVDYKGTLTWFGKNGRQKHFILNDPGFEPCPDELNDVVLVLLADFLGEITYLDLVTTLP